MDGVKVRDEKRVVGSIYAAERRRITEGCHSLTLIISISHRCQWEPIPQILATVRASAGAFEGSERAKQLECSGSLGRFLGLGQRANE